MTPDPDWLSNDALFFRELSRGRRAELLVGTHLLSGGLAVYVPELHMSPRQSRLDMIRDQEACRGSVDLYVSHLHSNVWLPLEAKSRRLEFSTPANYPFETALVDTVSGWKEKAPKPVAVILLSQQTSQCLVVPVSTEALWHIERHHDPIRHIEDSFFTCPKHLLRTFDDFVSWAHTRLGRES